MQLAPQTATVLRHLEIIGSITRVEAEACHRVRHLPTRIFELRAAGHDIRSERHKDVNAQRYVRYRLVRETA
jgi:hypothetical protein